jgi:hypothetical protein
MITGGKIMDTGKTGLTILMENLILFTAIFKKLNINRPWNEMGQLFLSFHDCYEYAWRLRFIIFYV